MRIKDGLSRVNILCPGPSLVHWKERRARWPGYTIAINKAIFTPIPIDAWVSCEADKVCNDLGRLPAQLYENPPPCYFNDASKTKLREALASAGFSYAVTDFWQMIRRHFPSAELEPPILTIWGAVALACELGATEIWLAGCDMEGNGDFDPRTGNVWENAYTEERWRARWERERRWMEKIEAALRGRVSLTYMVPPGGVPA